MNRSVKLTIWAWILTPITYNCAACSDNQRPPLHQTSEYGQCIQFLFYFASVVCLLKLVELGVFVSEISWSCLRVVLGTSFWVFWTLFGVPRGPVFSSSDWNSGGARFPVTGRKRVGAQWCQLAARRRQEAALGRPGEAKLRPMVAQ